MDGVWESECHKKEFVTHGYVLFALSSVWEDDIDAMRGHKTKMPCHWHIGQIKILLKGSAMESDEQTVFCFTTPLEY